MPVLKSLFDKSLVLAAKCAKTKRGVKKLQETKTELPTVPEKAKRCSDDLINHAKTIGSEPNTKKNKKASSKRKKTAQSKQTSISATAEELAAFEQWKAAKENAAESMV